MTLNFEFLKKDSKKYTFCEACIEAEKSLVVSPATTAILTRRALELAVKWVYSNDDYLHIPYNDGISSLVHDVFFKEIIDPKIFDKLNYIIKLGNIAVHTNSNIKKYDVIIALRNLFEFIQWINYCYADDYEELEFNEEILLEGNEERKRPEELKNLYDKLSSKDKKLEEIVKENEDLRKELRQKREDNTKNNTFKTNEISEFKTRKSYIDLELKIAGWTFGVDVLEEVSVKDMPSKSGTGRCDYVLYGNNGKPIGVLEAKRTSVDSKKGQQKARYYADCIEKEHGQRPVIFFSNGLEYYIWDDSNYPNYRPIYGVYTKDEIQLLIDRRTMKKPLINININDNITNRTYQKEAILAVCRSFNDNNERKALLVMATGSGKTRVAISIVDVLTKHNWVKNILFLADRTALVRQAKANFNKHLPNLSLCNLLDSKDDLESRMIFSTYPTMMNAIDTKNRKDGSKLFTVGHFDLIIIDESHRSIYKKYQAIFEYFDCHLLGLTATPRDTIDKNTYEIFGLENKVPTFAYELDEAIKDGYLVPYKTIETELNFIEHGIRYDDLSEEEKEQFEETFEADEFIEDHVDREDINSRVYNDDTIDKVINYLMEYGVKVEGGDKIGKTILFAKNHKHAIRVAERFSLLYPTYRSNFACVIDNQVDYAQALIDDFSTKEKMPQLAISVDMLDTGIDIPEIVNLVFFKSIRSKAKFWQMIGRGTRLCKDVLGEGLDKTHFLIFDFYGNFEFFRVNENGIEPKHVKSLTEKIYGIKVDLIRAFQHLDYQTDEYIELRKSLVEQSIRDIYELDENNFKVKQKLVHVHKYKDINVWNNLNTEDVRIIKDCIAPLIAPYNDEEMAKIFDHLMYSIEHAAISNRRYEGLKVKVINSAEELSKIGTIPEVVAKRDLLNLIKTEEFWNSAGTFDYEKVREEIRGLLRFIERAKRGIFYTNFEDDIINIKIGEDTPDYFVNDLKNYRKKVNEYLKKHKDELVIYKLRNHKKLTNEDFKNLEKILWEDLGSKDDYTREYGNKPMVKMVREIVGLESSVVEDIFTEFINDKSLNVNQLRFVKLVIEYVAKRGYIEKEVLQEEPFSAVGSIVDLFAEKIDLAHKLVSKIDELNESEGA